MTADLEAILRTPGDTDVRSILNAFEEKYENILAQYHTMWENWPQ